MLVSVVRCVAAAAAARYSLPGTCRVLTHWNLPPSVSVVCCPCSVCTLDFPSRHRHQRTTSLLLTLELLSGRQPWTKTTMRSNTAYSRFCDWLNKWDYPCLINAILSTVPCGRKSMHFTKFFCTRDSIVKHGVMQLSQFYERQGQGLNPKSSDSISRYTKNIRSKKAQSWVGLSAWASVQDSLNCSGKRSTILQGRLLKHISHLS